MKAPRLLKRKKIDAPVAVRFAPAESVDDSRITTWLRNLIDRATAAKAQAERETKEAA